MPENEPTMRIVNENHRTRRLAFREKNGTRHEVHFDEAGRAELEAGEAKLLIDLFEPIRKAEGPDDVAKAYLEEKPWHGVDATDAARDLAEDAGLRPEDVTGTGADGRVTKGDVERAILQDAEAGSE
jgi:pyruvate/2-oxoglutarate dehydrogenase complex dihydrolipoamide acyltransferase (E2) component